MFKSKIENQNKINKQFVTKAQNWLTELSFKFDCNPN